MYLSRQLHSRSCSQNAAVQRHGKSSLRPNVALRAGTVRCRAEDEDVEPRRPNRWIVLSDWTAVEFWTNITQCALSVFSPAAVPAARCSGVMASVWSCYTITDILLRQLSSTTPFRTCSSKSILNILKLVRRVLRLDSIVQWHQFSCWR